MLEVVLLYIWLATTVRNKRRPNVIGSTLIPMSFNSALSEAFSVHSVLPSMSTVLSVIGSRICNKSERNCIALILGQLAKGKHFVKNSVDQLQQIGLIQESDY
jgi:hypothetical protein